MKLIRWMICGAGMATALMLPIAGRAEETNSPDFTEVYDLIRSHLAGESEAELNRAAVQGLLNQLHAKVSLVAAKSETNKPDEGPVLGKTTVYDNSIACMRIARIGEGLAEKIASEYKEISATNHLKGIVLDLRYAGGHDYPEVAPVADLFVSDETPLLDWGNGMVRSKDRADAIALPVAVLVNQNTAAAAEALAAVLRKSGHAMIIGAATAGEATVGKEFRLKDGQSLRIATAGIKLGDGESLSASGLKPDIEVAVKPEDGKVWFDDPYKELYSAGILIAKLNGTSGTNAPARAPRTTEQDLMRERRERPGLDLEYATLSGQPNAEPEKPVVRDPVLGRALDLIKGLAVIRQAHAP